ncbi:Transcription initiation factor TFIID subunit 1 [Vitis vinifera]|uniref:Transcription initiation factor TFIID subunit 1 n=1 Tax=Vitis vinifera TaxID=29760 RepID=A0A438EGM5_VITVI|nr:Transcription initiation factor TFIID subunit 1 [Vitis vinifera]
MSLVFTFLCDTNQAKALTFEGAFDFHSKLAGRNKIGFEKLDKAKKKILLTPSKVETIDVLRGFGASRWISLILLVYGEYPIVIGCAKGVSLDPWHSAHFFLEVLVVLLFSWEMQVGKEGELSNILVRFEKLGEPFGFNPTPSCVIASQIVQHERQFKYGLQLAVLHESFTIGLVPNEEPEGLEEPFEGKRSAPLPILCVEDGMVILRFSEIFGIHGPLKKGEKRDRRYTIPKERYKSMDAPDNVEEDEEAFLKGGCQLFHLPNTNFLTQDDASVFMEDEAELKKVGVVQGTATMELQNDEQRKHSCISAEPMKEDMPVDLSEFWLSPLSPKFYPLDQQDWEDKIIWDNSPEVSDNSAESCEISGPDSEVVVDKETELVTKAQNQRPKFQVAVDEKDHGVFLGSSPVLIEAFGSRNSSALINHSLSEIKYHPQLLRLETRLEMDNSSQSAVRKEDAIEDPRGNDKDGKNLGLHAGAMLITRPVKSSTGDSIELPVHGGPSGGRFNIANDKFYLNRKTSQQLKSHSKKRTAHGVKILHSIPALKLQTMKLKLSK